MTVKWLHCIKKIDKHQLQRILLQVKEALKKIIFTPPSVGGGGRGVKGDP